MQRLLAHKDAKNTKIYTQQGKTGLRDSMFLPVKAPVPLAKLMMKTG